jgi:hypothetical protein
MSWSVSISPKPNMPDTIIHNNSMPSSNLISDNTPISRHPSKIIDAANIVMNSTVWPVVATIGNQLYGILNTWVRAIVGTWAWVVDIVKDTAQEIQKNRVVAWSKTWVKKRTGRLGTILSSLPIVWEWLIRIVTEPINTVKWMIDISWKNMVNQWVILSQFGTNKPTSHLFKNRLRWVREKPSRRPQHFVLNPRHRWNKISKK